MIRIIFFFLLICACATPYQRSGIRGGYSDKLLGDDTYLITIAVNGYTSETRAYEYFHMRAGEITRNNGYARYEVLDMNTSKKYNIVSGNIQEKPRVYGRIKCYRK